MHAYTDFIKILLKRKFHQFFPAFYLLSRTANKKTAGFLPRHHGSRPGNDFYAGGCQRLKKARLRN
jgi:hypothetical protein